MFHILLQCFPPEADLVETLEFYFQVLIQTFYTYLL